MQDNRDLVPNMLNKEPTALWGLTQTEILRVFIKCCVFSCIACAVIGAVLVPLALISIFIGLGIMVGCLIAWFVCKNIIAPKKGDTPYGFYEHKAKINSIWVKLGVVKLKTIHTTRLWRHFR